MIIVLAGDAEFVTDGGLLPDAAAGARFGRALASSFPRAAVLRADYFAPVGASNAGGSQDAGRDAAALTSPRAPWLAGTLAASAQRISAHGGTSVVLLPRPEDVSALLVAFDELTTPLYLFLLRRPDRSQGILRRAVILESRRDDAEAIAEEIAAHTAAGKGLIRPAPAGAGESSLLPAAGGPSTGIDIIEIERIARVVERYGERFLHRVYTEAERALYRGRVPELAARFAAKEAVSKALGTGIWGIRWREMEILPDMRGKPLVYLHGAAAARARALNLRHFAISLSHSRDFATAVVVAT